MKRSTGWFFVFLLGAGCGGAGVGEGVGVDGSIVDASVDGSASLRDTGPSSDLDSGEPPDEPPDASPVDGGAERCDRPLPSSSELDWTVEHDGRMRRARIVLPDDYSTERRWPLVLSVHALGSTAALQESYTRMTEQTRRRGFVVVYPEGTGNSWNAGTCCGTATGRVDDVGFLAALIDRAEAELCIDHDRVHATGMSNGGYMTHRLGCELADRLASIAPVAGADATTRCEPSRPLPIQLHHGTLDTVVPYLAGASARDAWRERNGCRGEPETFFDAGGTTCERWRCDAPVELCRSTVSHVWPGGVASPAGIDATTAVLDFFEANPLR